MPPFEIVAVSLVGKDNTEQMAEYKWLMCFPTFNAILLCVI